MSDKYSDQVPGRTVTESEVRELWKVAYSKPGPADANFARLLGITVVPDPEPTNEAHDRDWWIENANLNDAEDCEACVDDLCPVHHGIALGIEFVTKKIAALGDDPELFNSIPNPPKAPEAGGDDA